MKDLSEAAFNIESHKRRGQEQLLVVCICSFLIVGMLAYCKLTGALFDCATIIISYGLLCILQSMYQVVLSIKERASKKGWVSRTIISISIAIQIICALLFKEELLIRQTKIFGLLVVLCCLNFLVAIISMCRTR